MRSDSRRSRRARSRACSHGSEPALVREAILALPPLHREVLILAEYEELGMGEIAQIVGAEAGAVKVRLHRARQKLRAALETRMQARALVAE